MLYSVSYVANVEIPFLCCEVTHVSLNVTRTDKHQLKKRRMGEHSACDVSPEKKTSPLCEGEEGLRNVVTVALRRTALMSEVSVRTVRRRAGEENTNTKSSFFSHRKPTRRIEKGALNDS
jgi:hypothetical protein